MTAASVRSLIRISIIGDGFDVGELSVGLSVKEVTGSTVVTLMATSCPGSKSMADWEKQRDLGIRGVSVQKFTNGQRTPSVLLENQ